MLTMLFVYVCLNCRYIHMKQLYFLGPLFNQLINSLYLL